MKWLPIDQYHWRRECGRYFVDGAIVVGTPAGKRYCAWFKQHPDATAELLDCFDDLRGAITECASHLRLQTIRTNSDFSPTQSALAL